MWLSGTETFSRVTSLPVKFICVYIQDNLNLC